MHMKTFPEDFPGPWSVSLAAVLCASKSMPVVQYSCVFDKSPWNLYLWTSQCHLLPTYESLQIGFSHPPLP